MLQECCKPLKSQRLSASPDARSSLRFLGALRVSAMKCNCPLNGAINGELNA